ncbi:hypothetical protein MNB_SUP05-5-748 [hydrothermal vent metagenome]|uniref:PDZ domain-containing protein n=1 Tax=hydrothermal vent metagenome TaxID=652676 RepID=A0A1W1BW42_9ZZZZ
MKFLLLILLSFNIFAEKNIELSTNDKTTFKEKAFLGIAYRVVDVKYKKYSFGYEVMRVLKDTPADIIGLKNKDIIVGFEGLDLTKVAVKDRHSFLSKTIKAKNIGDEFSFIVLRQHKDIVQNSDKVLGSIKELKRIIDTQSIESHLIFSVNNSIEILKFSAKLSIQANVSPDKVPKNDDLFPFYKTLKNKYADLILKTIYNNGLQEKYDNLLQRYAKNELWDEGFRLDLFRYLHRDPLKLMPVIDSRLEWLEKTSKKPSVSNIIKESADWLDVTSTFKALSFPTKFDKRTQSDFIVNTINEVEALRKKAFAKLTKNELSFLKNQVPQILTRFKKSFYIDRVDEEEDRENNIKVINLTKKIQLNYLFEAGFKLAQLANKDWLLKLKWLFNLDKQNLELETKAGKVLLGGFGNNKYTGKYAFLVDYEGNDFYYKNTSIVNNGLSLIVDLKGNDEYQNTRNYAQGSAFMGIGILIDKEGDDVYSTISRSQGFSLLGIGILQDEKGEDKYFANHFAQAVSFWGVGVLKDMQGNDNYYSNIYSQAVGGVKGFGLLLDNQGNDNYHSLGEKESSYRVSGVFEGASQGVGIGFRGYASGGVGVLLDLDGNDNFRSGNFSQGVGYFYGLGVIKNAGKGDDIYRASRYSQGASAHSAIGLLIDDKGNDNYFSMSGVSQSAAWDLSLSGLWDKKGNDVYRGSPAFSSQNGFSLLIDEQGNDNYLGISGGQTNDYHGGSSFGVFIDAKGNDKYSNSQIYKNNKSNIKRHYGLFFDFN